MNTTHPISSSRAIDPELAAAVREWAPTVANGRAPLVAIEPRSEGQRVKMTSATQTWPSKSARPMVRPNWSVMEKSASVPMTGRSSGSRTGGMEDASERLAEAGSHAPVFTSKYGTASNSMTLVIANKMLF